MNAAVNVLRCRAKILGMVNIRFDNPKVSADVQHRHHIYHTAIITESTRR